MYVCKTRNIPKMHLVYFGPKYSTLKDHFIKFSHS